MKFLSAPATSAESERLFSAAALTLTDLHKSMSTETHQMGCFCTVMSRLKDINQLKIFSVIAAIVSYYLHVLPT
ncbi:hypothetical protein L596_022174 [Steinernema carpocapsae]|uniref:HAT C-terminal dimerisation domain-containing protein n=1 Tax=Steinernema carpocapsae TaxID=34508 RepID=A0A4U5MKZ5_STECR|nr:hypothetical protein L596_022174 [Steinernema carpocapsae]